MTDHVSLLREAVRLASENGAQGGRPFGAVLTLDGRVVSTGVNGVVQTGDPAAHAELEAVRAACRQLGRTNLAGAIVYASGHPCPMCLALLVATGVDAVYYAFDNADAEPYGLSSRATRERLRLPLEPPPLPLIRLAIGEGADALYGAWRRG